MNQNSSNLPGLEYFPIYIAYCIGGIIVGVSNLIIFIAIARYEALRTNKVYVIIMAQSLADSINMSAYIIGGIRRTHLIFAGQHNTLYTAWQCVQVPHVIIWSFSTLFANVMLCVSSLDRFLCVCLPLRYVGWTYKYSMSIAVSAFLYSIVCSAIGLIWTYSTREGQIPDIPAQCIGHNVLGKVHKLYDIHYNQAPIFWAFLSVCVYVVVWIIYNKQNIQISPGILGQQHQIEHQRKFTKSLAISCLCTFCLFIVPRQLGTIANKLEYRLVALTLWVGAIVNPFANVIIYIRRHEELRQALKGLFTCKPMPIDVQTWKANAEANKAHIIKMGGVGTAGNRASELDVQDLEG